MSYNIQYSQSAVKELKKLEKSISENIVKAIERIRIRPYEFVQKIVGTNYFRLKVRDYRVIIDIKNDELIILVIQVAHRRNIYKKK
ncbi:MAG: type II toxin-antitoxin system RelE/ParE family toxin [Candidatus Heimdallarchaeota archaeon]|nr:type II toxin-antitoxin system RelE/ParE family toxin [Candidatus Heimdallarchaeota archaeon]